LLAKQRNQGAAFMASILRMTGYLFLCVAMAAVAYDGMRMIADNGRLVFTSVEEHWLALGPANMDAVRAAVERISPLLWSPLITAILAFPAWMVAGGLGVLTYLAGYRPPRPSIPDGI
jgi:hypothetical protein